MTPAKIPATPFVIDPSAQDLLGPSMPYFVYVKFVAPPDRGAITRALDRFLVFLLERFSPALSPVAEVDPAHSNYVRIVFRGRGVHDRTAGYAVGVMEAFLACEGVELS